MAGNSRLAVAIHVAGMLSVSERMPRSSEALAQSINTNPVVVRRIIGLLAKNGLVKVKMGAGGGARLSRKPEEITLAEIYLALEEGSTFDVPQLEESHCCRLSVVVRPVLSEILKEAENSLVESLEKTTLADVIGRVKARMNATSGCKQENN